MAASAGRYSQLGRGESAPVLTGVGINAIAYGVSAAVFLIFTTAFMAKVGPATYAEFSILLNSASALLLLGNYHIYLVSYSVATDRGAYRRMFRLALRYAALAAIVSGLVYIVVARIAPILALVAVPMFLVQILSGMPTAPILATRDNWYVTVCRAGYQVLLIAGFAGLFLATGRVPVSFVVGALFAGLVYFIMLDYRARDILRHGHAHSPPSDATARVLVLAVGANVLIIGTMLMDKIAIKYLGVGPSSEAVGIFFLYYDIAARLDKVYLILLGPMTYAFLEKRRGGEPAGKLLMRIILLDLLVGAAALALGYEVVPPLYGIDLSVAPWLPAIVALSVIFEGCGAVALAFCGAAGLASVLTRQYATTFIVVAGGILVAHVALGDRFSVTYLASILALGQSAQVLTVIYVIVRVAGDGRVSRAETSAPS